MLRGLIFLICTLPLQALAESSPRIGLVLSGGGARGLAHIGVLRALEDHGVRVDAIAGTSMGAIVGALYASGKTPDEIEDIALEMDWYEAFSDLPPRERLSFRRKQESRETVTKAKVTVQNGTISLPRGVVQGQNLQLMLQRQLSHVANIDDFDRLPIPFRAVAADLVTGEAVVFERGSLATALRASMSVPGLFAPVETADGKLLADGGIANNLPVDVALQMGVDRVIAVDIATPLYGADELDSVIPILEQLTTLLTSSRTESQYTRLGDDDVLIEPDLSDIATTDFDKMPAAIARGYAATNAISTRLAALSSSRRVRPDTYARYVPPIIDRISIHNETDVSDDLIRAQVRQVPGEPLNDERLREDIASIYGYEYFETVTYDIVRTGGERVLQLTATEKTWGSDRLSAGIALFSDTRAESGYNLGLRYDDLGITRRGGEWITEVQFGQDPRVGTELYLPLDFRQRVFARPYASYSEEAINRVQDSTIRARARIDEFTAGLFAGIEVRNDLVFGVGIERRQGDIENYIGEAPAGATFDDDLAYIGLEVDTIDNAFFPRDGLLADVRLHRVSPDSGRHYSLLTAEIIQALSIAENSLVVGGRFQRSSGSDVGRHLQASLGGFANLSGARYNSYVDDNMLLLNLSYMRRLNRRGDSAVDLPLYAGLSIETGNVWSDAGDISLSDTITAALVMVGMETPLGPLYFGYGRTERDDTAFYVRLGHSFRKRR